MKSCANSPHNDLVGYSSSGRFGLIVWERIGDLEQRFRIVNQ